ncbi:MAG: aldehyde dehydrogenase family protein [Microlunatus sp.]|nr:aldehyde dehydrogenase family protein [Microlunatus sp.]MDN5770005.1 aldehyde dehydrogenase family protein [Microlunatus sp.]
MTNAPLELRHLINGEWVTGTGDTAQSTNPADPSEVVAGYTKATTAELDAALGAAEAARSAWDRMGVLARGKILRTAAGLLEERAEQIAVLMTREEGKILGDARGEIGGAIETLYYHAGAARRPTGVTYPSANPDELVRSVRRPVGVVGVITPWNFPLQIPAWKIAPALMWGNTVVWKSASDTPAVAVALAEVLVEAGVPAGVLNLLLGPGSLGAELVADSRVDAVTFTGSVPVGHQIRQAVIGRGARLQMELGGHNPAVVLPDADIPVAAAFITAAAMGSTGQKCTATRRVIAVGSAYEALKDALTDQIAALRVGPGLEDGVEIGPLVSARARDEVAEAIDQAVRQGATVLAQANLPQNREGAYVPPTLLEGDTSLSIAEEEVFGPVTLLMRANDLDSAIELANATEFGLTASVFTRDEAAARRCLDEVDAGLIKINGPSTGSEVHAPFGGVKDSSFPAPREQGSDAVADFFSVLKTAYVRAIPNEAGAGR